MKILFVCLCMLMTLLTIAQEDTDFAEFVNEVKKYDSTLIVLQNQSSELIVSPKFQGRILKAYHKQSKKSSNSWVNMDHIRNDTILAGGNPYGGEHRIWIGPLGGQHGLYYQKHLPISDDNWFVPPPFDQEPFDLNQTMGHSVNFSKGMSLSNYIGTEFDIEIDMRYELLEEDSLLHEFSLNRNNSIASFGYTMVSTMTNKGEQAWDVDRGMLSLWHLGNVQANDNTRFVMCLRPETNIGQVLQYFADFSSEELILEGNCLIYNVDGLKRGKIGIPPALALNKLYVLDPDKQLLSVINFDVIPDGKYFNSYNRQQEFPYQGEVVAVYNSDAIEEKNGFFEFETMSPCLPLKPLEYVIHKQQNVYFYSLDKNFDALCKSVMGAELWRKVQE